MNQCATCKRPFDPNDPMNIMQSYGLYYHPACYERVQLALRETGAKMQERANSAHIHGGYCPLCRAVRPPNSVCWEE